MKKRSQKERLIIAKTLVASVWEEYCNGSIEEGNEQIAVYIETYINRIQWKIELTEKPRKEDVMDLIERQAAIDELLQLVQDRYAWQKDALKYVRGVNAAICAIEKLPSAQPIGYAECANAMLKMWMDNVLTDGEYNRIMDKLNEHWGKVNA